jgi:glutathione synthase
MKKLKSPVSQNYLLSKGKVELIDAISELSVFGIVLNDGTTDLINQASGHLLRTKRAEFNQGGLAIGIAGADSPYLTP